MQLLITTLSLIFTALLCSANVAMPGVWTNSAGGEFTPLFVQDAAAAENVQMQSEHIVANIYPGFAVVKGTYWMYNHSTKPVQLTVGYPVNPSQIENVSHLKNEFTDIYELQVKINGQKIESKFKKTMLETSSKRDGWYLFPASFPPKDTLLIEVYYLLNTSAANYTEGHSSIEIDAFTYILESGRAWKDSIDNGIIEIHFNDLKPEDIYGIKSNLHFNTNERFLLSIFQNLEPSQDDNVIIWYEKKENKLGFEAVCQQANSLYNDIDGISKYRVVDSTDFKTFTPTNDLPIGSRELVWIAFLILVVGLVIFAPIILIGIFVYELYKFIKQRRARNKITHEQTTGRNNNG